MTKNGKVFVSFIFIFFTACEPSMNHEAKEHPFEPSHFFPDGALARQPVDGTIDRSPVIRKISASMTMSALKRGQSRFMIYCAPCHGDNADGHGMIVQHGFLSPPPLYRDDIREKPDQFFFDVMTNGYGAMYSYADRLDIEDRWTVVSYLRALQLSQHFAYSDLSESEKLKLGEK
jgi:mono/diheme cytochrome c family protein